MVLISRSVRSTGPLSDMRLANEMVQPVQLAADSQMMGGPSPAARTLPSGPRVDCRPSAAAEAVQYFKKSRLVILIGLAPFFLLVPVKRDCRCFAGSSAFNRRSLYHNGESVSV